MAASFSRQMYMSSALGLMSLTWTVWSSMTRTPDGV